MMGRGVIITGVVVYLAITLGSLLAGSSGSAGETPRAAMAGGDTLKPSNHLKQLPLRGVGMQIHRIDWIDEYKKNIDEIAAVGADTVLLVVDARMENGRSSAVYIDMRVTPTPQQLGELIRHAKDKKLRVVLMPIVLLDHPRGMEWRGTINPESWPMWWESYRSFLHHFSWIAQAYGADVLVVGSELVSTETMVDEWRKTIAGVRKTFKGLLTYSANWDHYWDIPFWDQLDFIGMNSYWKLGEDHNVSIAEIQQRWAKIQARVLPFVRKMGKPLLFLEVGWCSLQNAAHEPWDYTRTDYPTDLDLQRKLYEGFFRSWYDVPELGGFMVWEWTPGDGGPRDSGYTPEGKPAEKILKEWMNKPRWTVK